MRLPVALIQLDATSDVDANIDRSTTLAAEAASGGARLVVLPEYLQYRGGDDGFRASARPIPGPFTDAFADVARRRAVWILAGSLAETSGDPACPYNTSVLIDPDGGIAATYRKIHLFDVGGYGPVDTESARVSAGDQAVVADVDGVKVGLSICYDLRFPELYRALALAGAEVLAVPSNFTERTGRDHWEVLLRARAIENGAWVVAPGQSGGPPGNPLFRTLDDRRPVGHGRCAGGRWHRHRTGGRGDGPRRRGPSSDPVACQPAAGDLPVGIVGRHGRPSHFTSWIPMAPAPWMGPPVTGPFET